MLRLCLLACLCFACLLVLQVPENFPYFHVEFGCNGGFAHVIENSEKFDHHLGKSVIAGLLDIDSNVYLKPKPEGFEADKK